MKITVERKAFGRKTCQSKTAKARPDDPLAILKNTVNAVLSEALGIAQAMAITDKSLMPSIKFEETRTVSREPQVTIVVFQHSGNAGQLGAMRILLSEGKLSQSVCLPIKYS